jgi:Family of unknown function (DUF6493)
MSLDPQQLAAAVLAGDVRQVRGLLRDATEADRRACAESLKSFLTGPEIRRGPTGQDEEGLTEDERILLERRYTRLNAAAVAAKSGLADGLRTAVTAAGTMSWISPWDDDFDEIANVYADRRPPWLAELADQRLQERFVGDGVFVGSQGGLEPWLMVRRLVRLGAIARPAIPQYTTRMPISLYHEGWVSAGQPPGIVWRPDARPGLLYHPFDGLLADPGLLDDEVWRLFEVPGAARELARCKGTWEEALVTLSERGLLDRGRLLDACLDAFFKDFAPTQVGWYATFHDRLAPTLGEVAARAGKYLALLATNYAHGVSLAQRACDRLLAAGRLPLADFLAASAPLLLFPQKGVALRQLKLLGKIAKEPALRPLALATAAGAFGHARLDVQEAALDLIGELGVPEGAEAAVIAGHAAHLAPALTGKAAGLGLLAAPPPPAAASAEIPLIPAPAPGVLPPLEDPAELIRLLTQLMEDAPDALAVEQVMAGAVRLATLPESDRKRLGSPLVKRAKELLSGLILTPHALSEGIARLALAWACVPFPPPAWLSNKTVPLTMIPAVRAFEACHLIKDGPAGAELLAEPSAADGSVHPDALLARLATWRGAPVFRYDLEVALLEGAHRPARSGPGLRLRLPDVPGGGLLAAALPLATRTRRRAPAAAAVGVPRARPGSRGFSCHGGHGPDPFECPARPDRASGPAHRARLSGGQRPHRRRRCLDPGGAGRPARTEPCRGCPGQGRRRRGDQADPPRRRPAPRVPRARLGGDDRQSGVCIGRPPRVSQAAQPAPASRADPRDRGCDRPARTTGKHRRAGS